MLIFQMIFLSFTGDSCDLGGNCYLDEKSNPHCKCPDTSKGVHCEIPESCLVIQCKNNGKCLANGQCSCPNGWTGFFCEIATNKFSLPSFNGKSYMIVPSQRLTHKDKRNQISSQYSNRAKFVQVSMNISTINTNGLFAWSDSPEGDYLGFGLENGFFKLVSNLMNFSNQEIDIPSGGYLSDGGWHNIKLDVDEKGQIALLIDHKLIYNEVHSSEKNSNLDHIGGSFYVGK
jgi:protein eyes shut